MNVTRLSQGHPQQGTVMIVVVLVVVVSQGECEIVRILRCDESKQDAKVLSA